MVISFIVPAHDEEASLAATLRSLQRAAAQARVAAEFVVVDDASTDRTAEVAGQLGARVVPIAARQISAARNAGAAAARGDAFVFVDADTQADGAVVAAVVAALDGGAAGGGATVRFDPPVPLYARLLLPVVSFAMRRFGIASGCFLFCTRAAFAATGGFDEEIFAGEEAFFSRALRRQGRLVILRESVVTSARKLRSHSAWQILGTLLRLGIAGRRGLTDRGRLALWYGPRRTDPAARGPEEQR